MHKSKTKFWLIGGGGIAVVVAVVLAVVLVPGMSSKTDSAVNKPDITNLTDAMLLTEGGFPAVGGDSYGRTSVKPVDLEPSANCEMTGKVSAGWASVRGARLLMAALIRSDQKFDLTAVAHCQTTGRLEPIDVPGLPAGVVTMDYPRTGEAELIGAGYVRGILVVVHVQDPDDSMDQAKADLVAVYNAQADKLNKA